MSYFLPHLTNGWQVDQAILSEEDRLVIIRFGRDWDPICMKMDETLYSVAGETFSILFFSFNYQKWAPSPIFSPAAFVASREGQELWSGLFGGH